jgi:hypothetical protein
MDTPGRFNLNIAIDLWGDEVSGTGVLTEEDIEELKSHLIESVENLKSAGLNEEAAFSVSLHRMEMSLDLSSDFEQVNRVLLQTKRLVAFSKGILLYFFSYYTILIISKFAAFISVKAGNQAEVTTHISWIINAVTLITVAFLSLNLLLKEARIYRLLALIHFKSKQLVLLFSITFLLALIDRVFIPIFNSFYDDRLIEYSFIESFMWFGYLFPLVICIGYISLYYRFFRKL